MSLRQEIETWVAALAAYDNNEFDNSLKCFEQIADTSKILFNLGVINATLGEHAKAVDFYQRAVQLDHYLAVAYFQQGVSNFLMGDFEEALANFNDTLLYLRGNNNIDYEQLGLKFKLYSCEVLFNRGLCYIYLQQKEAGMQDLMFAAREKRAPNHDVIDEAIRESAEGYLVFSIPVGVVYRPNEAKVKNLKTKDYLGKARLVAAQERQDPGRARAALAAIAIDDRPEDKLSYAALNLVKPDLRSRGRQQSEPPLQRNVFPPTPPPEPDQAEVLLPLRTRRKSSESMNSSTNSLLQSRPAAKQLRLELGAAAFDHKPAYEKVRTGTKRSESERPAVRRQYSDLSLRREHSRPREQIRSQPEIAEVRIEEDPIKPSSTRDSAASQTLSPLQVAGHSRPKSSATSTRSQPTISEEDEEGDVASPLSDPTPLAFEIIPPRPTHRRQPSHSKRIPDLRRIRIKVHAEDMRYVMTHPGVKYAELAEQIRQKFNLQPGFKLKVKDEDGDLITIGDDDDLEIAIGLCKAAAAKEKVDLGKMDIWVQEL